MSLEWFKSKQLGAVRINAEERRKVQNDLWIVASKTQKKKFFCIVSWRVMKNEYATIIRKNHGAGESSILTVKPNIHWRQSPALYLVGGYLVSIVYYELLQPNEIITGEYYQQQLMQLSRALKQERPDYAKRTTKWFSSMTTLGHMLRNRSRKHLKPLTGPITPYFSDITSDYHLFRWLMACLSGPSILMKIPKMGWFVGNLKRCIVLLTKSVYYQEDGKK